LQKFLRINATRGIVLNVPAGWHRERSHERDHPPVRAGAIVVLRLRLLDDVDCDEAARFLGGETTTNFL
jgi:hypothetical protein